MVLVTESRKFKEDNAAKLLERYPKPVVEASANYLRKRGVIVRTSKGDKRHLPGRTLVTSDA